MYCQICRYWDDDYQDCLNSYGPDLTYNKYDSCWNYDGKNFYSVENEEEEDDDEDW